MKLATLSSRSGVAATAVRPNAVLSLGGGRCSLFLQLQPAAGISTSKKKRDVTISADKVPGVSRFEEETVVKDKKNWVSFGFSTHSEEEDVNWRNAIMFFSVTIVIVGMSFQMAYWPDVKYRDWGQRQAYIELARREALGLPAISPDLVPVENINLPSDEELGDFEVII